MHTSLLQFDHESRERQKYVWNVYCVAANQIRAPADEKPTNCNLLAGSHETALFLTMAQKAHSPVFVFTVQSSFFTVQSSFFTVQSLFFTVQSSFFTVQSSFFTVQSSFFTVQSSFLTQSSLHFTHSLVFIIWTVQSYCYLVPRPLLVLGLGFRWQPS